MISYIDNLTNYELIFLIIGFFGQFLFASRFIYQWIYSEKKGTSLIPIGFWYLSIFGGIGLFLIGVSVITLFFNQRMMVRSQQTWEELQFVSEVSQLEDIDPRFALYRMAIEYGIQHPSF